jgi:hypothetical protein
MRSFILLPLVALALGGAAAAVQGCSSSSATAPPVDGGDEAGGRVLACSPATDAGVAAAVDAGIVVKILKPTDGQTFTTSDHVPFSGTGFDPKEGTITDPKRMIWNIGDAVKGVNPDGEGPEDTGGPYPAGTYTVRFDVSNLQCLTAAAAVTITVR